MERQINRNDIEQYWSRASLENFNERDDGDSFDALIFDSFKRTITKSCRLAYADTFEISARYKDERKWGLISRGCLKHHMTIVEKFLIQTLRDKTGVYGRLNVEPFVPLNAENVVDLFMMSSILIDDRLAISYHTVPFNENSKAKSKDQRREERLALIAQLEKEDLYEYYKDKYNVGA